MNYLARKYQLDCADAWYEDTKVPGCKPIIAVPTGAGKTVILGILLNRYLNENPHNHVLVLSHTQEILLQDHNALSVFFPDMDIAFYSAGLGYKDVNQITVAGIQSAFKNPEQFKWTDLVIIDEVHTVNHKAEGMYRTLLNNMQATVCGMSATIYRTGHGLLHEGKGVLFNKLSYDLTSTDNFNKLVEYDFLCELISVAPDTQLDSSKVRKSGGDYNVKGLAEAHDKESITEAAINEALEYGRNYKKWLVFAIDISHANHINSYLNRCGIKSAVLHSRMRDDRGDVIDQFKIGKLRAIVSVGMVTTGFNAPNIDLILLLRPTMSAVLHVQMVGRGLRTSPGKRHCLVLDYAGNTARLGPINNVRIPHKKGESKGGGEAPTKTCPECSTITFAASRECESCGYQFEFEIKISTTADDTEIVEKGDKLTNTKWLNVKQTQYILYKKPGRPDSIQVTYNCGITRIKEWWTIDHPGYAGYKACHVVKHRGYLGPLTVNDVLKAAPNLKVPKKLLVDFVPKFPNIVNVEF